MRILLDVMGGDLPPEELVKGGIAAGCLHRMDLTFVGDPAAIRSALARHGERDDGRFSILPASEVVAMDDHPVVAVRSKRDSSLIKGLLALRDRSGDAFVSPGNTGAVVVGSIFTLGRIHGIPRPGIAVSLPSVPGPESLLIDAGANADCTPPHLVGFARMGATYAREVMGIPAPRIALLSNGVEAEKGNRLLHRARDLLAAEPSFIGNVEGHAVLSRRPADVVVCDGFVGNVFLKATEGGIGAVTGLLKGFAGERYRTRLGGLLLKPAFSRLRERLSYKRRGGAPLLGVDGVVVIAHGRSDAEAIGTAIDAARRAVEARVNERLREGVARDGS